MPTHPVLAALVVLLTAAALAACQSTKEAMIARGADPAYAEGYDDGCESGKEAGGGGQTGRKDGARYGADPEYTKGWNDAFPKCQADMERMVRDARRRNPSRDK